MKRLILLLFLLSIGCVPEATVPPTPTAQVLVPSMTPTPSGAVIVGYGDDIHEVQQACVESERGKEMERGYRDYIAYWNTVEYFSPETQISFNPIIDSAFPDDPEKCIILAEIYGDPAYSGYFVSMPLDQMRRYLESGDVDQLLSPQGATVLEQNTDPARLSKQVRAGSVPAQAGIAVGATFEYFDGEILYVTGKGENRKVVGKLVGDQWEAVEEVNMPDEVAILIEKSGGKYVWDSEKNVVYDPVTGLLMGVQLPDGEWKTDFEGIYTVTSREGETIKLPIYVDGEALLDFLETSDVIRDDKDIIKKGGQWVQDKEIRPKIYLSPQLERPDNQSLVVYVQVEGSGLVSVQHLLEPAFHFVEDLKTFFVFKLGEFKDLDSGLSVSLVAVPVKGGEQLVFVLGSEQTVFENMRSTANEK